VTFARLRVMPNLPIFLAEHPALDVDVVLQDGDIDLIEPGIDVARRMSPLRDSALTGRKIGRGPMRVVGTPAYFAATGVPQAPTDPPAHQAIIYEQRSVAPHGPFGREPGKSPSPSAAGSLSPRRKVFRGGCLPAWALPSPENGCSRPS
jgi:DNA-binding transcriptional LysR family regulator